MLVAAPPSLESTAERLASLLLDGGSTLSDPGSTLLDFEPSIRVLPLNSAPEPPVEVWAVDGGQAIVADARCVHVAVTRAARVRFVGGRCVEEDDGELRAALLGDEGHRLWALGELAMPGLADDCAVDINLLRDRWEWDGVARAVAAAPPGSMVLVDGDLQPDWRIPRAHVTALLADAMARGVTVAGITKHTALARGGAPLLAQLEREAEAALGERAMWWASVGRTRADEGAVHVVAARLDPFARFSFRIDLPAAVDAEQALRSLATLCNDAAFPGYPYPLTVADRIAAIPGWLRAELRYQLDDLLARADVPEDVRERAFADRHRLMERA